MLAGGLYQLRGDLLDPRWHILVREAAAAVESKEELEWTKLRYDRLWRFLARARASSDPLTQARLKALLDDEEALFGYLRLLMTGENVEQDQETMVTQARGAWEQEFGKRDSAEVEASIDAAASAFQQLRASVRQGRK